VRSKFYHAAAGAVIALLFPWFPAFSCGLAILAGFAKEVKDIYGIPWLKTKWPGAPAWVVDKGEPSIVDLAATYFGWLVMVGLIVSIRELLR
jgi:hypothetical protein